MRILIATVLVAGAILSMSFSQAQACQTYTVNGKSYTVCGRGY